MMPIDTQTEALLSIPRESNAAMPGGRGVHQATWHRWMVRGCRGVRLEFILIGGRRFTSAEAMNRFFAGVTAAAAGGIANMVEPPAGCERKIAAAERKLQEAGI